MEHKCAHCAKKKERTEKEYKDLINRLNRIEGQVRGVKNMVENDAYCMDIITQASAIAAALNSFNKVLLSNHIKTCVVDNIREGNDEVVDELITMLKKSQHFTTLRPEKSPVTNNRQIFAILRV